MKKIAIKSLLIIILILYSFLDEFTVVLPFVLLLFLIYITELKSKKKVNLAGNKYAKSMFWLIIISIVTLYWSPNKEEALFQIIVMLVLMLVGFLYYYFIRKYQEMNLVLFSLLVISFVNHIGALGLSIFNRIMYTTTERGGVSGVLNGWGWGGRFSGTTQNPNSLSVLLLFSLFLSLLALDKRQSIFKLTKPVKVICVVNILLSMYSIFMTQSRKGMVFGVLLLVFYAVIKFSVRKVLPYLFGIVLLINLPSLIPGIKSNFEGGIKRTEGLINLSKNEGEVDNSSMIRLALVEHGWQKFKKKPIFGYGVNSFRHYFNLYSHNNFIELLFGLGLIGLFIYYNIYRFILKKLFKNWRRNVFVIYFVFILLTMDVGYVSYESKMNMLILIVLLLIVDGYSKNNTECHTKLNTNKFY